MKGGDAMADEARAVSTPWSCRVTFTLDGLPPFVREACGHTAGDAAALARSIAVRGAEMGVWVTAYQLVPAHRIVTVDLADPVEAKAKH